MGGDTLVSDFCGRYKPIPVDRMRVSPLVKKKILSLRSQDHPGISFEDDARITVVIPFRDREHHLIELVPVLTKTLQDQKINYRILVVEQSDEKLFNRGKLKNIGVHYSLSDSDYFCFHDVDNLPVNADYRCPSTPLRLVKVFETTWRESNMLDGSNFGGVVSLRKEDFLKANGYSNEYWGWGKEDDDLFIRMILSGLVPFEDIEGIFRELPNPDAQARNVKTVRKNKRKKARLCRGDFTFAEEGISTLEYEVIDKCEMPDYSMITVRI